ncbi:MAG: ABC transporter permease subunit [Acidimicrobiia bacterium]
MTDPTIATASPAERRPGRHVSPGAGVALVYRIVIRQLVSRGRLLALGLMSLLAPIAGFAIGASDTASTEDAVRLIAGLGFAVVIPVVALVFGTAAIGDLRDDKTLVYLWLRPLDRWPVVVGAALAALTIVAPLTLVPVVAAAALTGVGSGIVSGTLVAGAVGAVAYVAVFTLFGVALRRATVWGLAYILIWEGFIAQGGAGVARFALRKYTRSILVERTGVELDLADFSLVTGIVVPLVVAVAAVVLASVRLSRLDVD